MSSVAPSSLAIIANPRAGRGRATRLIPRLQQALGSHIPHTLQLTSYPGEETALARAAAEAGAGTILALGGDGTWGNVVRGIMASGRHPRLALLAAGTGNDLAFATGLPAHDLDAALDIARGSAERRIDLGEVDGVYFVNCAGFGFDAEVLRATRSVTWLRGHIVYLLTAARMLVGYRGFDAALRLTSPLTPGDPAPAGARPPRRLLIVVSNGPRFGGGFLIAPDAKVDDGELDLVQVADTSAWRRLRVFASAVGGTHVLAPEVTMSRERQLTLNFAAPPEFDADGELHQARSATVQVRCHPGALRLAVPSEG